jgi:septal ring-binding cell division protein DamX
MRDAHRMKERFDLSLDNRQVGSLLIGGIVVLGAVFVLGVVVGKKLAGNEETRQADDILSALDRKADQAAPAAAEVPLTFQEELTRKRADPVAAVEPKSLPEPEPAAAEVAPSPKQPAQAPESAAASAESPKRAIGEGKVEQAAVPTRAAEREGGLADAFDRAAARPPAEAVKGGAFTLQLSASQSREEADRFVRRLRDRGYAPYIVKAEVAGKGTWYRVRMGSFPTKDAAQRYLADFKRETQLSAFVAASE